jgi:hypothetical protein
MPLLAACGATRATVPEVTKPTAIAEATKTIDAGDAAFNAHDARAMIALLDDAYFSCGPRVSTCKTDPAEIRHGFEAGYQRGASVGVTATREKLLVDADPHGGFAWFVADYTFRFTGKDGPVDRLVRETGALVRRGSSWRFVMLSNAWPLPDEQPTSR